MTFHEYSYKNLPFTKLFKTYVEAFEALSAFYSGNPFEEQSITEAAKRHRFAGRRKKTAKVLEVFNDRFNLAPEARRNLDRLEDSNALTIVTGQQLGMFGGPLHTILKTVATIHLSKHLEKKLDRPVIPVFWLADEDHDYDEIKELNLPCKNDIRKVVLEYENGPLPPVSEITLPDQFEKFHDEVRELLPHTDFSADLWSLLNKSYKIGVRMDEAFGSLLTNLFSHHGLILAGSNQRDIKELTARFLQKAVTGAEPINEQLHSVSEKVEVKFHQQATVTDSHLFYLSDEYGRIKIQRNGTRWFIDGAREWSSDELKAEIEKDPSRFSPNVFLRPIIQSALLPTLGYVAGPGEVAYYAQMKSAYEQFNMEIPLIFPRLSATFVEPPVQRVLEELPFDIPDFQHRIEDLESEYVQESGQLDLEEMFNTWKTKTTAIAREFSEQVKKVDPTLEGAAGRSTAVYHTELDKLKGKTYRAIKQQEEIQLNRIRKVKNQLFPHENLQERVLPFIYFMNKYGIDLWDRLLDELDEDDRFQTHKFIYL